MYIRRFTYKKEDVDCKLCTEYRGRKKCPHKICPYITERIEAGAVTYEEAINAMVHMVQYNETIYAQGQAGLSCQYDYQKPSFRLSDYGLSDEVFGVISIPAIDLEMPIFLGATEQHMADGAAHLSQTSLPIGGGNTNSVIAGHRGYNGASYFRYIDKLKVGDVVSVTNLWEELTYRVSEIKIIDPYDVTEILIQPGRELLTLLTCHPYASGGRQRYVVYCERVESSTFSIP